MTQRKQQPEQVAVWLQVEHKNVCLSVSLLDVLDLSLSFPHSQHAAWKRQDFLWPAPHPFICSERPTPKHTHPRQSVTKITNYSRSFFRLKGFYCAPCFFFDCFCFQCLQSIVFISAPSQLSCLSAVPCYLGWGSNTSEGLICPWFARVTPKRRTYFGLLWVGLWTFPSHSCRNPLFPTDGGSTSVCL